jgi:hypothetical protein
MLQDHTTRESTYNLPLSSKGVFYALKMETADSSRSLILSTELQGVGRTSQKQMKVCSISHCCVLLNTDTDADNRTIEKYSKWKVHTLMITVLYTKGNFPYLRVAFQINEARLGLYEI